MDLAIHTAHTARALAFSSIIWPGPKRGAYLQYGAGAENDAGDDARAGGAEDGALNVGVLAL